MKKSDIRSGWNEESCSSESIDAISVGPQKPQIECENVDSSEESKIAVNPIKSREQDIRMDRLISRT